MPCYQSNSLLGLVQVREMIKDLLIAWFTMKNDKEHAKGIIGGHPGDQNTNEPDAGMSCRKC